MASSEEKDLSRRWTVVGMLNGIKAAFGLGGKHIISAGGSLPPGGVANRAINIARVTLADRKYQTRMTQAENKLKMWANDYEDLVRDKLRSNFHPENFARMQLMVHTSTNVLQRVVRDVSLVYESPPRRTLEIEEPEEKPVVEVLKPPGTENLPPPEDLEGGRAPRFDEGENSVEPEATPMETGALNTGDEDIDALADVLNLEGSDKRENGPLDKLLKHAPLDATMETVEWFARFLPVVWVRPFVRYEGTISQDGTERGDPAKAKLDFIIYTPAAADVVPMEDDPTQAAAWFYWSEEFDEKGNRVKRVNFFTKDEYTKLDEQWRVVEGPKVNELGELPIVALRLGKPVNCYYIDGQGDDLYEGTLEVAVLRTIQNARARDAGFKQVVLNNTDEESTPADQVMGGPTPIYTNDGGSASILDLQPNLKEWTELTRERNLELSAKYGISGAEYKAEGNPQSGFAKKLDHDKILKENKRVRKFFVEFERELYKKTRRVLEVHPVEDIGALPDEEYTVDFAEPSFAEDPKTQAMVDAQRIKLNIDSVVDVLKRENPDLSEKELIELAHRNKRINEALVKGPQLKLLDFMAGMGEQQQPGATPAPGTPPGENENG